MRVCVIVPAAGSGTRFGGDKLAQELGGRPLLLRTVEAFTRRSEVESIIVAGPADAEALAAFRDRYEATLAFHGVRIVAGGRKERWETVLRALAAVPASATHVAVHDAARPWMSDEMLDRVFSAAKLHPAVIPGIPISSTVKRVGDEVRLSDPNGSEADAIPDGIPDGILLGDAARSATTAPSVRPVLETVPRAQLVAIQTPQVFERGLLAEAYAHAERVGLLDGVTDDAQVVERFGREVMVVLGDARNIKVTTNEDLALLRAMIHAAGSSASGASATRSTRDDDGDDAMRRTRRF